MPIMWDRVEEQPGIHTHQKFVSSFFFKHTHTSHPLAFFFLYDTTVRHEHYLSCAELSWKRLAAVCNFFSLFFCQPQRHFHVYCEWQHPVRYTDDIIHLFMLSKAFLTLTCLNLKIVFTRTHISGNFCAIAYAHSTSLRGDRAPNSI